MSVSVDLDVLQDLAVDLKVAQGLPRNHAGEPMTSLVDVLNESVYLEVVQPLFVVVLKAAQLLPQRLAGRKTMIVPHRANNSVVKDVVHYRAGTKKVGTKFKHCRWLADSTCSSG